MGSCCYIREKLPHQYLHSDPEKKGMRLDRGENVPSIQTHDNLKTEVDSCKTLSTDLIHLHI